MMAMQRRRQDARRHGMVDDRETPARLVAIDLPVEPEPVSIEEFSSLVGNDDR